MKQKKLLGYVFGYKDSEQTAPNQFKVNFFSGTSKTFPSKYKNKKDFYSIEVREGDHSEIYCDPLEFMKEVFDQLKKLQEVEHERSWQEEEYEKRKYVYSGYGITNLDTYIKLEAVSYARLEYTLGRLMVNLDECITQAVATIFDINYEAATAKWNKFQEASIFIYEEELKKSIGQLAF